jgi:predicted RND superfamily exporter protein
MKKWILFLFVGLMGFSAHSQNDTLILARPELKELLMTIRQDSFQDTVDVKEKRQAIMAIQDVLKTKSSTGVVIVPRDYVLRYIERLSWEYEQMERYVSQKNKLLRISAQYYAKDPTLKMLNKENGSGVPEFYRLNDIKKKIRQELKYEATLNKKSYELKTEEARQAALNETIKQQ